MDPTEQQIDDWWHSLSPERRRSVHRWISGPCKPVDPETDLGIPPLFDIPQETPA